jgi:sulfur-carrier protein adenylyltransferase/sulfurtransferase
MEESLSYERYQRQMILKGFGEAAQQRLLDARVLVVGAGGLGCPLLMYLVGAGLGRIGVIDRDQVSLSNLHRQPLFSTEDLGMPKASVAVEKMRMLNPEISINAFPFRLTQTVCLELFPEYDLVVDCTDNFATRYMINDACVLLDKVLVTGAVSQYEGQVIVLNAGGAEARVNYRDLFPEPVQQGEVLNCAEAGVLGALPGVIGSMMAGEVIKFITGIGQPLVNRLLTYQLLSNGFYDVAMAPNPHNIHGPSDTHTFLHTDYEAACGLRPSVQEIDPDQFERMVASGEAIAVDVREMGETPALTEFEHLHWPLSRFDPSPVDGRPLIFFCQSGIRSLRAASLYQLQDEQNHTLYSLRGGILAWKQYNKSAHVSEKT